MARTRMAGSRPRRGQPFSGAQRQLWYARKEQGAGLWIDVIPFDPFRLEGVQLDITVDDWRESHLHNEEVEKN